jgi:AcrR family transcriptional regulator
MRPLLVAAAVADSDGVRRDGGREVPLGEKARRTRARLLLAAYEQFSATGYRATKAGDICARAGTSLGTFYQYFRDRADVMTALVAEAVRATLERNRAPWQLSAGREGIRRVIADFVEGYAASSAFQAVWEEATHVDEELARVRRDLGRYLTETVEHEFRRGPARRGPPA